MVIFCENVNCYDIIKHMERQELNSNLNAEDFKDNYYLKTELIKFCRQNNLQASGSKIELTNRVFYFLKTGKRKVNKTHPKKVTRTEVITLDSLIEENFVCSEKHRAFYKLQIGKNFKFCVPFQKWLKNNAGKTYRESITQYQKITESKNKFAKIIDKQFEYNTYIRDFFNENKDKNLKQAICCWNYKKSIKGSHKYEKSDLIVLQNEKNVF